MILGQLKIGDVKRLVEACLSTVECSNEAFVNLGHVPWKAWTKHWCWLALLDPFVWWQFFDSAVLMGRPKGLLEPAYNNVLIQLYDKKSIFSLQITISQPGACALMVGLPIGLLKPPKESHCLFAQFDPVIWALSCHKPSYLVIWLALKVKKINVKKSLPQIIRARDWCDVGWPWQGLGNGQSLNCFQKGNMMVMIIP